MDISEIFSDSYISYPFSNSKRIIGLGFLLSICSLLIIPVVFAGGYLLRIIENTLNGDYELPPFGQWRKMFIDGLKVITVVLLYMLPGIICFSTVTFMVLSKNTLILDSWLPFILMILAGIMALLGYILSLAAIPRMVYKDKFKTAFNIKNVIKDIFGIGLEKYAISLIGFSIMAIYLILIAEFLQDMFSFIGLTTSLIGLFIINILVYSLLIASQGRFIGLVYLEGINKTS
ncbi:DUF4013 domain-containing protein [Methanobacterium sp.]|uniref:DUF4013 domain-containing protein n=1 Tax=Methanobacterium sp. TaxID=2164 RepID=UPI003C77E2DF